MRHPVKFVQGEWANLREKLNLLVDCVIERTILQGRGVRLEWTPAGTYIHAVGDEQSFWARITDVLEDAGNNRFKYGWQEVTKTAAGFGLNKLTDGSRSGTTATNYAVNMRELMNTNAGLQGNGVDVGNLAGTAFVIKAASVGTVVRLWPNPLTGEYEFEYTNSTDGTC